MAYLRFAPKCRHGYKLTDLDSETIDGKVFTRKLFRHSISVRFNGRDYQATVTVVLKRQAGADGEDFVVKSTLLDSGIRDLKNEVITRLMFRGSKSGRILTAVKKTP